MPSPVSISPEPSPGDKSAPAVSPVLARLVTGMLMIIVPIMIGAICWRWATAHGPTTAVVVHGDASVEGARIVVTGGEKRWEAEIRRDNEWQVPILLDPGPYEVTVTHHGRDIIDAAETNSTVTITTSTPNDLEVGGPVVISGVGVLGYNGTFDITGVNSPTQFTYTASVSGLARSSGGRASIIIARQPFLLDNLHGLAIELPSMVWIVSGPQLADAPIEIVRLSSRPGGPETFTPIEVNVTSRNRYRTVRYLPAGNYQAIVHGRQTRRVDFTVERTGTLPLHVDLAKAVSEDSEQ